VPATSAGTLDGACAVEQDNGITVDGVYGSQSATNGMAIVNSSGIVVDCN
jgi:hypothetical protein